MSLVICPRCDALLKVQSGNASFFCTCGVELQHPDNHRKNSKSGNSNTEQREIAVSRSPSNSSLSEGSAPLADSQTVFSGLNATSAFTTSETSSNSHGINTYRTAPSAAVDRNILRNNSADDSNANQSEVFSVPSAHSSTDQQQENVQSSSNLNQKKRWFTKKESKDKDSTGADCSQCGHKFGLLRKWKRRCRNCEEVVCNNCSKGKWPHQMLPKENNPKNEKWLRVCSSCQIRSEEFRTALLKGNKQIAEDLVKSGVVQLYFPYHIYPEKQYPIHCAVESGDIELVQWMISKRCNPRVVDAKGQSALAKAAAQGHFEICKFLVFRGYSKPEEIKDVETLQKLVQTCFITLQKQEISLSLNKFSSNNATNDAALSEPAGMIPKSALEEEEHLKLALKLSEGLTTKVEVVDLANNESQQPPEDECVVCLEASVETVLVPCGHMCCCEDCATRFTECPVCREQIEQVVKTYRS